MNHKLFGDGGLRKITEKITQLRKKNPQIGLGEVNEMKFLGTSVSAI